MATAKSSKAHQKPYQGKAQPNVAAKRATSSSSTPIKGLAGMVAKHNSKQKSFAKSGKVTSGVAQGMSAGRSQMKNTATSSKAEVSQPIPKRQNLTTFRDLLKSGGAKFGSPVFGYNQPSIPADFFGATRTPNLNKKKTAVSTPTASGPKAQYSTKKAFKGAGLRPAVLKGPKKA